ncbi:MAG: hypothetical protein HY026_02340 [Deltaproteobacteria bacterium]|nr:hypothetical protein [Deltaproteobacteria bacterium]
MDLLRAYSKNTVDSRRVESRQGKTKSMSFLSAIYCLPSTFKKSTIYHLPSTNNKGIALVVALLMSVAIMALVAGILYFITQSTIMSGAGKRYATASEAADGAINVVKDSINKTMWGETVTTMITATCTGQTYNLSFAILNQGSACQTTITLTGISGDYRATVTLLRLYTVSLPGGRLEFARTAGGAPSTAIFYRITVSVQGPNNATAENSALYRFTG